MVRSAILVAAAVVAQAQTPVTVPVNQAFGQVAVNGAAAAQILNYTFSGYATPTFSVAYPGLDYSIAGRTCSASGSNLTCAVSVSFRPTLAGLRQNAIIAKDTAGKVVGTTLLYGIGLGPQIALYPATMATVAGKPGLMGSFGENALATLALMFNPQGIAVDSAGNLYIADSLNSAVRQVTSGGIIKTVVGRLAGMPGFAGDGGLATNASLNNPIAVAVDGAGSLYIVDQQNNRIRKVANGQITTVAGGGAGGGVNGIGDGGLATNAILSQPNDVAVDGAGNLFIAIPYAGLIRRVDATTRIITTYASGFSNPRSVAVDAAGNLYVAETGMVRKLDTNGTLTLIAQTPQPVCVRVDAAGNVYIADQGRNVVLQVNGQTQMVSVIAGNGGAGSGTDGMIATDAPLDTPSGIALDAAGNLYIADYSNAVRKTSPIASLPFPTTLVGEASATQTISVANIGNQPLTFSGLTVNTNYQQQIIDGVSCSASTVVAAGGSCTITLAFAPKASGIVNGNVILTDSNLNTAGSTQVIPLSGTGAAGAVAQISFSPSSLTFAAQAVGSRSPGQTITISNPGTAPLNISSIRLEGANATDFVMSANCPSVLVPNASCSLTVYLVPSAPGVRNAALVFVDNLATSPQRVALSGNDAPPQISVSPSALVFNNQPLTSIGAAKTITISNTGSSTVNISSMAIAGVNSNDFHVTSNSCGSTVAVGASCLVTVNFSPSASGLRSAVLSLTSNAAGAAAVSFCGKGSALAAPAVWRPANAGWYSTVPWVGNQLSTTWGVAGDIPVMGDYDGDGKPDLGTFRPSSGTWAIAKTSGGIITGSWGTNGDIPVPADYDGDGKVDIAIFRPSTGMWAAAGSTGSIITGFWGTNGDIPVPADYDGDGKADIAIFRPSEGVWVVAKSSGGIMNGSWGMKGDIPVPGDYDGDGKADIAIYRPSDGTWAVAKSSGGVITIGWGGQPGDTPVPGDYDGDGKTDFAIYRPSKGTWCILPSRSGAGYAVSFGASTDLPLTSASK
jgi:sugar lactone lactonase YvrE